jgi:DNA-dependent RNA polymerase auxiliary subunit epsilon
LNFKTEYPRTHYNFTVQAFDRDFFKSNDVIGSAFVNLKQMFEDVELTKRPLLMNKKYHDEYMRKEGDKAFEWDQDGESFWIPML